MSSQAALITGASRGIGLGAAMALAKKGFAIAINCLEDGDEADQALKQVSSMCSKAVKVIGDVSDLRAHEAILREAEAVIGPLTTLVNNAGVSVLNRGDLLEVSEASYDRCMDVNAKAHFFLSQAFAKRLVTRERSNELFYSLIAVTSANASAASIQRGEYCASKSAAAMIAQLFAARLGAEQIAVYDVRPGVIETDMTKTVTETYRQRVRDEGLTLLPRTGKPDDIGEIIATLASGGLPYTTGHVIAADGGMLVSRF